MRTTPPALTAAQMARVGKAIKRLQRDLAVDDGTGSLAGSFADDAQANDVRRLLSALTTAQARIGELEAELRSANEGYARLGGRLASASARIEALEGERDANRAQAIHLTAKLSEERRFKREFEEACRAEVVAVDAAMVSLRDELAAKTEFVMQAEAALTAARTRAEGLEAENARLRMLLCLRHHATAAGLYLDDGELQCAACGIDFKRMSAEDIERRFADNGRRELAALTPPPATTGEEAS